MNPAQAKSATLAYLWARCMDALDKATRAWSREHEGCEHDVNLTEDDLGMREASAEDLTQWVDDLGGRVGLNTADFARAIRAYVDVRNSHG